LIPAFANRLVECFQFAASHLKQRMGWLVLTSAHMQLGVENVRSEYGAAFLNTRNCAHKLALPGRYCRLIRHTALLKG
jgi:hypothetical protein